MFNKILNHKNTKPKKLISLILTTAFVSSSFLIPIKSLNSAMNVPDPDQPYPDCHYPEFLATGWQEIATQTLTKENSPYCFEGTVTLPETEILTIEQGAVIKFGKPYQGQWYMFGARFDIFGKLYINGTQQEPVIFTSFYDDSYFGDTNMDGDATSPAPGDWAVINLENNQEKIINWAIFKYGAHRESWKMINAYDGYNISITNSVVTESARDGIHANGDFKEFKNNRVYNNGDYALQNWSIDQIIDVRHNWWGSDKGPDIPGIRDNPDPNASKIGGFFFHHLLLYDPWTGKENIPVSELEPVILLPGITGSWPDLSGELKIDPYLHTYDNLLDALRLAGYEDNVTLFQFPYEWRQDNNITANELKEFIGQIKTQTGKQKVDLIGHSMGGIVSRSYVQSDNYQNDVDQIIFLGTPHIGSPHAYVPWESGGMLAKGITDWQPQLLNYFFGIEASFNGYNDPTIGLLDYVRNKVISVQQLLPIFDYLRDKATGILRQYPNNYPQNVFLEDLNKNENIDKLKQRAQITNIASDMGNDSTVNVIRVVDYNGADNRWEHGYPEDYDSWFSDRGLEYGQGDETVPLVSSTNLGNIPQVQCNAVHRQMPTNCQREIIYALTNKWPSEIINIKKLNGFDVLKNFILIHFFSPVEFNIEDEQGNKTGIDIESGDFLNQIQDSFTGYVAGKQVVFIPNANNGGDYIINLKGTGSGSYELYAVKGSELGLQETMVNDIINNEEERTYYFDYDSNSDEPIEIKNEQITIDDVIQDIKEIIEQNGFKHPSLGSVLINLLERVKSWQKSLEETSNWIKQIVFKKMILRTLGQIQNIVENWFNKHKISQTGYDILTNDINILIQNFNNLN